MVMVVTACPLSLTGCRITIYGRTRPIGEGLKCENTRHTRRLTIEATMQL
jgi:hypothetical protein